MNAGNSEGKVQTEAVTAGSAARARAIAWFTKLLDRLWFSRNDPAKPVRLRWTPELMERFWDGFSKTRLVELSFSRGAGRALIAAIAHLLPKNGRILDFGAGDGDLIELMCARGLRIAAYEPSKNRTLTLEERMRGQASFLGTVNPKSEELFDVVMLVEVIEHILEEQLGNSLELLAHFTRPGGILIVTTPNNEDLDLNMAYCPVSNTLFHRWQHVRSFTRESLASLLGEYGFEEVVTHELEFNNDLYVPYDVVWGSNCSEPVPSHMSEIRANRPVRIGAQNSLLYIGQRSKSRLGMA